MKPCPKFIYLQACDECYEEASKYPDGVTWCEDGIQHECEDLEARDTKYVRFDLLQKATEEIEDLKQNGFALGCDLYDRCLGIIHKYIPELENKFKQEDIVKSNSAKDEVKDD